MGKYKVIVTARSFGKADDQALRLLEEHGCDVVRLAAGDAAFDEQIKKENHGGRCGDRRAGCVFPGIDRLGRKTEGHLPLRGRI